ncbi:MAG: hypothetical protein M1488_06390 [Gammaproteobacteria bacterium]|nr:hypothetical protein [Gammaproteobacteria bacterium]
MTTKDKLRNYIGPKPGRKWIDAPSALGIGSALLSWVAVAMSAVPVAIQISILLGLVFPALFAFVWARDRLGLALLELRGELALLVAAACIVIVALRRILEEKARQAVTARSQREKQASCRSTISEKIELIQLDKFLSSPLLPARRPGARVAAAT